MSAQGWRMGAQGWRQLSYQLKTETVPVFNQKRRRKKKKKKRLGSPNIGLTLGEI
jgi:hypothetical protein